MMRNNVSNINIEKNQNSQNWSYVVNDKVYEEGWMSTKLKGGPHARKQYGHKQSWLRDNQMQMPNAVVKKLL